MWTWVSGSNTAKQVGVYGAKGTPAAANVPGARIYGTSWTDSSGNLWLFGGSTITSGYLNDLWRYDPSTSMWTWVSGANTTDQVGVYGTNGVPDVANVPGARVASISWTDSAGNFWLFGGRSANSTYLNDLWLYDPSTNLWTWMSGSDTTNRTGIYGTKGVPDVANMPGARSNSISWTDGAGNLWLFGGHGYGSTYYGYLNDLWRYDPSTNVWTWMSGSNTANQVGVYGTKGVPADANVPGGRQVSVSWIDDSDNLWLFGGDGYDSITRSYLNDLWRYDPSTSMWTWVSGANTTDAVGVYGTKGVPDVANVPGARGSSVSWADDYGNFWLFGGEFDGTWFMWGDLWRYNPSNNIWTWVSGSSTGDDVPVHGTKGDPDLNNTPGARFTHTSWGANRSRVLWLFGGFSNSLNSYNDLWRYNVPQCVNDGDCSEGYQCVESVCEPLPDNPPAITAGPYLAAGWWPLLPTSAESAFELDVNYDMLWTFSDDFVSCSGSCTHVAEYQEVGGSSWTALPVRSMLPRGGSGLCCRLRACKTEHMPSGLR